MKNTMNSRNIAKYHKLLEQDVSLDKISKYLNVSKDTLKRFTPDAIKKAKAPKPAPKPALNPAPNPAPKPQAGGN